jgi:hypothetical protein
MAIKQFALQNKRKLLIIFLFVVVSIETLGAILNRIVISANGGMPAMGINQAFGKWVPLDSGTKFAFLSDVIRIGDYAVSIGDLFLLAGIATNMIAIWLAFPPSRKFFPILIASFLGILWSIAEPNMVSALICEMLAIGFLLVIFWKYHSTLKKAT